MQWKLGDLGDSVASLCLRVQLRLLPQSQEMMPCASSSHSELQIEAFQVSSMFWYQDSRQTPTGLRYLVVIFLFDREGPVSPVGLRKRQQFRFDVCDYGRLNDDNEF